MGVYLTPFATLAISTSLYATGDALGASAAFASVPEHGTIMSVVVTDLDSENVNLDVVFFNAAFTGTADNAAFDPSDADLALSVGSVLVDTWKSFSDNSQGVVRNVGLPYWAAGGVLYFQCVTRGGPTYAGASDVQVRIGIIY